MSSKQRLETDEVSSTKLEAWEVYNSGKRNVSRLHFNGWKAGKDQSQTASQTACPSTRQHAPLPDSIPHYQTACHTTRQHPTLPDSIPHYQTACPTTRQHPTLPESMQHYHTTSNTTRQHAPVPDNIRHYQTTSDTTRIKDRFHPRAGKLILPYL